MDSSSSKKRFKRSQFAVVLVLAPLNNTFDRKCLVVPFAPDALKLGRQTTTRSAAASDNGLFDSRVLSRQHAEIWADRDTGQVWLKDCKSSNGTYINKQRLSAENTESEPYELKRNDELDLGIDIVSNDETKQMYQRISARVEKVSIMLLNQTGQDQGSSNFGSNVTQTTPAMIPSSPSQQLSRKPSLETLKVNSQVQGDGRHTESVFGGSLDTMTLNFANSASGVVFGKESIKNQMLFDTAAKKMVAQIRAIKTDTARLESLSRVLDEIKGAALEAEKQEKEAREKKRLETESLFKNDRRPETDVPNKMKSASLAALKAENARLRAEQANYAQARSHSRTRSSSIVFAQPGGSADSKKIIKPHVFSSSDAEKNSIQTKPTGWMNSIWPQPQQQSAKVDLTSISSQSRLTDLQNTPPSSEHVRHNIIVLFGTVLLVTVSGVLIMFFFNPPMVPISQSPPFTIFSLRERIE